MSDNLSNDLRELAAQLDQLKAQVRRQELGERGASRPRQHPDLEQALDASWVNPHQPIAWPHWPSGVRPKLVAVLQKITRRLLSWYIDPLIEEQNTFNAAVIQNLQVLYNQVTSLRLQLDLDGYVVPEHSGADTAASPLFSLVQDRPLRHRLRLAFFTPLSPLKTAIADHSEGLLVPLAGHADVDLYIDDGYQPTNPTIVERFAIYNHCEFPQRARDYDAVLYAMGDNADFHAYIYQALLRYPGVVILHDITLHRFMIGLTLRRGDIDRYLEEMEYAYGLRDLRVAEQVLAGFGEAFITRYPFIERVLDSALGVIVHNGYARREILTRRPGAKVARIGQHFFLPPGFHGQPDRVALRAEMGLTDRFVVASFGIFVPHKRLDACLGAFARLAAKHPQATYLFVGDYMDYDLPGRARALGLENQVIVTGWLDPARFTELMFIADVGIHLRYPHIGGTPFSPIRMMGLGLPTIVSDIAPLAEFPEGCCIKVPPDESEEDTLFASLKHLAEQPDFRHRLGETGRRFLEAYHSAPKIAQQYLAFIEQAVMSEDKINAK